jgi:hypothetical protein
MRERTKCTRETIKGRRKEEREKIPEQNKHNKLNELTNCWVFKKRKKT